MNSTVSSSAPSNNTNTLPKSRSTKFFKRITINASDNNDTIQPDGTNTATPIVSPNYDAPGFEKSAPFAKQKSLSKLFKKFTSSSTVSNTTATSVTVYPDGNTKENEEVFDELEKHDSIGLNTRHYDVSNTPGGGGDRERITFSRSKTSEVNTIRKSSRDLYSNQPAGSSHSFTNGMSGEIVVEKGGSGNTSTGAHSRGGGIRGSMRNLFGKGPHIESYSEIYGAVENEDNDEAKVKASGSRSGGVRSSMRDLFGSKTPVATGKDSSGGEGSGSGAVPVSGASGNGGGVRSSFRNLLDTKMVVPVPNADDYEQEFGIPMNVGKKSTGESGNEGSESDGNVQQNRMIGASGRLGSARFISGRLGNMQSNSNSTSNIVGEVSGVAAARKADEEAVEQVRMSSRLGPQIQSASLGERSKSGTVAKSGRLTGSEDVDRILRSESKSELQSNTPKGKKMSRESSKMLLVTAGRSVSEKTLPKKSGRLLNFRGGESVVEVDDDDVFEDTIGEKRASTLADREVRKSSTAKTPTLKRASSSENSEKYKSPSKFQELKARKALSYAAPAFLMVPYGTLGIGMDLLAIPHNAIRHEFKDVYYALSLLDRMFTSLSPRDIDVFSIYWEITEHFIRSYLKYEEHVFFPTLESAKIELHATPMSRSARRSSQLTIYKGLALLQEFIDNESQYMAPSEVALGLRRRITTISSSILSHFLVQEKCLPMLINQVFVLKDAQALEEKMFDTMISSSESNGFSEKKSSSTNALGLKFGGKSGKKSGDDDGEVDADYGFACAHMLVRWTRGPQLEFLVKRHFRKRARQFSEWGKRFQREHLDLLIEMNERGKEYVKELRGEILDDVEGSGDEGGVVIGSGGRLHEEYLSTVVQRMKEEEENGLDFDALQDGDLVELEDPILGRRFVRFVKDAPEGENFVEVDMNAIGIDINAIPVVREEEEANEK
mmetsp:Transcript_5981/g.10630  ORF Transcript_5981/g.10630 Transcript_5981/m.10630 type:complete len:947 (-) Transcript_5981:720-3560(-)